MKKKEKYPPKKVKKLKYLCDRTILSNKTIQEDLMNTMDDLGYAYIDSTPITGNEIIMRFVLKE